MRVLVGPDVGLRELYAAPRRPWLRVNMVSTVDGAATGDDGTSRSIQNDADQEVFRLVRDLADVIIVGAGTLREEGYAPNPKPIVVVTRSGQVPDTMRDGEPGKVLMATCSAAPALDEAREILGDDHVMVLGQHRVDLARMRQELEGRGFEEMLSEGGPHLLRDLLEEGVADEVMTTIVPTVVAGRFPRITDGAAVDVALKLHTLAEQDGTLLARWLL
jgi:riboflavin biosynthesis pyrimidine reductase